MKELIIEAKREMLDQVLAFLDEQLEECGCPMKAVFQLEVAVEELYVNIASYAYPGKDGNAVIRIDFIKLNGKPAVEIVFEDEGIPFDPLARKDPDVTLSAEEREIGHLGIYMVKKSMDDVAYCYRDGKNILTIRKTL